MRRQAKINYVHNLIPVNRKDAKKLWTILNCITGKLRNKKDISDEIIINGIKESNKQIISNEFADYCSEIGKNMAEEIERK